MLITTAPSRKKNYFNPCAQLTVSGLLLFHLVGCQTIPYEGQARNVKLKPKAEGIISIPQSFRDEDRLKAESMMSKNCSPFTPEIIEEGEVVVGQEVSSTGKETQNASSEKQVGKLFGIPLISGDPASKDTKTSSVTKNLQEWQISYRCNQKKNSKNL